MASLRIDDLPDSLLLHIFSFLGYESLCLGTRLVCQRWHKISHDSELWQYIDVPEHFSNKRLVLLLQQIHEHIEGLECSKAESLTEDAFLQMARFRFPKLTHIAMPIINRYRDEVYDKLVEACPELEELENVVSNVDDTCHPLLCQAKFPTLKVVHDRPMLSYGRIRKAAPNLGAQKRSKWLEDLTHLSSMCPNIDGYKCRRALDYLDNEAMDTIGALFPNLLFLELNYTSITDEGVIAFFLKFKGSLKEIILDKPGEITDNALRVIAQRSPELRLFKLCRSHAITNEGIQYLVDKCPKLQEVHLNNTEYCTDDTASKKKVDFSNGCVYHISKTCTNLSYFRVFYSSAIDQIGIWSLAERARNLRGLMLYECSALDDSCLQAIANMKMLRTLSISNSASGSSITPKGLLNFILLAPCLVGLTFFTSSQLFKEDMAALGEEIYNQLDKNDYRPNVLKRLTLRGVGGGFLQLITVLCPELHTLDLREANLVGPYSLSTVVRNCENLKILDVRNAAKLDDNFLQAIIKYSSKLRNLDLGMNVRFLSTQAIAELFAKCPSLTSVAMDTQDTDINLDMLEATAKRYHGGRCVLHIDPDCRKPDPTFHHNLIEFHFTPMKFLSSLSQDSSLAADDHLVPVEQEPLQTALQHPQALLIAN